MEPLRRNLSGGVQATAADIYISYIHIHIYIYISKTYLDAEFDVESFRMVYLASKGRLGKVICEKHTFLNVLYRPTVRVSQPEAGARMVWGGRLSSRFPTTLVFPVDSQAPGSRVPHF